MSSTPNPILMPVAAELGAALVGLVVSHRGRTMTLSGRPGSWEAIKNAPAGQRAKQVRDLDPPSHPDMVELASAGRPPVAGLERADKR